MIVKDVDREFIEFTNTLRGNEYSSLLEGSSKNVGFFAQKMLGIRLRAWQMYALSKVTDVERMKKFFVLITSRQIGKSMASAIVTTWAIVFNKFPGGLENNTSVCIISAGDTQAKKLLREIKKLFVMGDTYMQSTYKSDEGESLFGESFFTDLIDDKGNNNMSMITLKAYNENIHGEYLLKGSRTGSTVVSYSPTSSVLGETFSLIIVDEAGKSDRITDEFFYEFLMPTGDARDAVFLVLSTPWESSGFFYRYVNPDGSFDDLDNVEVFAFDVDAIAIESPEDHKKRKEQIKKLEADGKFDEVQRAYYCQFVKTEQSFFDPDTVYSCFDEDTKKVVSYKYECDVGIDFGAKRNSRTVVTTTTYDEATDSIVRIHDKVFEVGKDEGLIDWLKEHFKNFNVQRIIYDDADTGQYVVKEMEKLGWNIYPMSFRADKVKKYSAFRGRLNTRRFRSYVDNELRTEMLALINNPKRARSLIGAPPGYNDDRIDSLICASFFYLEIDDNNYSFKSSKKNKEDDTPLNLHKESLLQRIRRRKRERARGLWENEW